MQVTTTIKIQHEYAIGSLNNIKIGNLSGNDIKKTFDLEEAISFYEADRKNSSSLIYLPNMIGVYRRVHIGFTPEGANGETVMRDFASKPYDQFNVHPSLVQIGFDPEFMTPGVVTEYIGGESGRMIIQPYKKLDSGSESLKKFSDLTARRFEGFTKTMKLSKDEQTEYLSLIREMLKTDGLTRPDYIALRDSSNIILF